MRESIIVSDHFRKVAALSQDEDQYRKRSVLRAISAAWAPSRIQVQTREIAVDLDEVVMLRTEEVTRAEE